MAELYATTMQLVHVGGGSAFDVAAERALDWVSRAGRAKPDLAVEPMGEADDGSAGISVWWQATLDVPGIRALEVRMRHPDDNDRSLTWQATATVSEVDEQVRATVRLDRLASVHVLRPAALTLRAPGLVTELMRAPLLASAGQLQLTPGSVTVAPQDVEAFVNDVLKAPNRALPVVFVASTMPLGLVEALARGLAGLAQVARTNSESCDARLNAVLKSSSREVPTGGLRLFWPGFGAPEDKLWHRYWTAAAIRRGRDQANQSVLKQLADLLAPISTGRVPGDPVPLRARRQSAIAMLRVQRERDRARRAKAEERAREAAEAAAQAAGGDETARELAALRERAERSESLIAELEQARDAALSETEQFVEELSDTQDQLEGARAETDELRARLATAEQNLQAVYQHTPAEDAEEEPEAPAEAVSSWPELAEELPALCGPGFHLTNRAFECATKPGRYPNPDVMWTALRDLEAIGRTYNELGGQLGKRFVDFAAERAGIEVALTDGTYTETWFEYDGEWHSRLPHVKIDDAKSPEAVGRIYFALDTHNSRVVVDWFGTEPDRPNTKKRL
jgi:hypothetical protein